MGRSGRSLFLAAWLLCVLGAVAPAAQPSSERAFLRRPDIHGDTVVFTCEGDLWLGDLRSGNAQRLTRDDGVETDAAFSPDGTQIAYSASYDGAQEVYVIPTRGGAPRRVTYRNTSSSVRDWSPDGSSIVFISSEYPKPALFSVPAAGGYPTRLPLEFASHFSYSPDGKQFVFNRFLRYSAAWFGYEGGQRNDIWLADPAKLSFRRIYQGKGTCEYPAWLGDRIYFTHDEDGDFSILSISPSGSDVRRVTQPASVEIRSLRGDGKRLIYEKGLGLEMYEPAGNKTRSVRFRLTSDLVHAMPRIVSADRYLSHAHLGPTGKRALVEARGQILSVPCREGEARVLMARDGVRFRLPAFSPDAAHIAYVSDETGEQQVHIAHADGTKPRQLTKDSGRQIKTLRWSPDGRRIAITDSRTRLRLVSVDGKEDAEVARGAGWSGPAHDFSPDGRWLVYAQENYVTGAGRIVLRELESGKETRLGEGLWDDSAPSFSTDGRYLAFVSRRNIEMRGDPLFNQLDSGDLTKVYVLALRKDQRSPFLPEDEEEASAFPEPPTPPAPPATQPATAPATAPAAPAPVARSRPRVEPVAIDLDGLYERVIEVPVPAGGYSQVAMVGDRVLMVGGGVLSWYDLREKKAGRIAEGVGSIQLTANGRRMLLNAGAATRAIDSRAVADSADGRLQFGGLRLRIDPRAEWRNIYWDSWRLIRDYFYVENMHGANWKAVGDKYAPLLDSVRSRDELNELIRWMLAELSISHAGVGGGDGGGYSRGESGRAAFLGIDVEPDPSGFYRITRILRGDGSSSRDRSPLAEPGLNVREGEFLIEVAGVPAKAGEEFLQALAGRAGQVVSLKINSRPSADGARTVRIRPVESESRMRYLDWVQRRREYVANASEGKVGYVHIPHMMSGGMAEFARQYFTQRDRQAMLVDVRFNTGGNVSDHIMRILSQEPVLFFNRRSSHPWTRQWDYYAGPMACLINEFSSSCGEEFPHYFRARNLGPLVGRRTWGGEVGSSPGWSVVDGGVVNVPNYGAFRPDGSWEIEGEGVRPDFDIESDPNAYARGKDAQLDKAIALMLEAIRKNPTTWPKQPPDPTRVRPPREQ